MVIRRPLIRLASGSNLWGVSLTVDKVFTLRTGRLSFSELAP